MTEGPNQRREVAGGGHMTVPLPPTSRHRHPFPSTWCSHPDPWVRFSPPRRLNCYTVWSDSPNRPHPPTECGRIGCLAGRTAPKLDGCGQTRGVSSASPDSVSPPLPVHSCIAADLARCTAERVASLLTAALTERPRASLAVSGGRTPAAMLTMLSSHFLPWVRVDVLQVDERVAPDGHPDRNLGQLSPLADAGARIHPLPVAGLVDDVGAASVDRAQHAATAALHRYAPTGIDVVHLGLGDDGHTASLVPGDAALSVDTDHVVLTGEYQGRRRLTVTFATLARARHIVWLVSGPAKEPMIRRLLAGDPTIPAGRVRPDRAELWTDVEIG
jgi:6-phosphogluconolactonase